MIAIATRGAVLETIGLGGLFSSEQEAVQTLSKVGSRGDEVRKIQEKLTSLGYLNDKIDGIYGEKTRKAVAAFQKDNGLTADGLSLIHICSTTQFSPTRPSRPRIAAARASRSSGCRWL